MLIRYLLSFFYSLLLFLKLTLRYIIVPPPFASILIQYNTYLSHRSPKYHPHQKNVQLKKTNIAERSSGKTKIPKKLATVETTSCLSRGGSLPIEDLIGVGGRLLAVVGGQPLGAHVLGLAPGREVEAALLEAGARGVGAGGDEEAEAVLLADEHRGQLLQQRAVRLGGPRDLERRPEVRVHQHALRRAAVRGGGQEHVDVRVLAGRVRRRLVPARDADGRVAAPGAERGGQQAEQVAPARPGRAVPLQVRAHVGEEVAFPERRAVDEALHARGNKKVSAQLLLVLESEGSEQRRQKPLLPTLIVSSTSDDAAAASSSSESSLAPWKQLQ
jgi:hypothetical protein